MQRLSAYAEGKTGWGDDSPGEGAKKACKELYSNVCSMVDKSLKGLLDRTKAREMETFTMHDRRHGLKVAHLMWHVLKEERRKKLTPPEIAMLVLSAFLHDVNMALSPEQREKLLEPESELWLRLDLDPELKAAVDGLKVRMNDQNLDEAVRQRARRRLEQAEEALLCQDTRERHATRERYEDTLQMLRGFHTEDPANMPDVDSCLSYQGDSFTNKLLDICVSHDKPVEYLVTGDDVQIEQPRLPRSYPLGQTEADLLLVAAALRIADILDFDRERTPPVLYHYLLPTKLTSDENRSLREWRKHMAISSWHISNEAVVFKGHCYDHVVHHAIALFCREIATTISSSYGIFEGRKETVPFALPPVVREEIQQHSYTYVPYRFELDDDRVYQLLMGGQIYNDPLMAVRELIQNAVDACKLHDALLKLHEPHMTPSTANRIFIRYEEPSGNGACPRIAVKDSGTGMDDIVLTNYFLKVGRSYYNSVEFNQTRLQLRQRNVDFAPVSEFGIGFLSAFLLADRLEVTTAMWRPVHGDTRKRTLIIDGPTRLIRMSENKNEGLGRFTGTEVALDLCRGAVESRGQPPSWDRIVWYVRYVCQELPYDLHVEHVLADGTTERQVIRPLPKGVQLPPSEEDIAVRIPIVCSECGLTGEIVAVPYSEKRRRERSALEASPVQTASPPDPTSFVGKNDLLRGGFRVDNVPRLPNQYYARVRMEWDSSLDRRYKKTNLARNSVADNGELARAITRAWLHFLLARTEEVPPGIIAAVSAYEYDLGSAAWLEEYDALTVYRLCRTSWVADSEKLARWETDPSSEPLPFYRTSAPGGASLDVSLLRLVLPTICEATQSWPTLLVLPPKPGWQDRLRGWRTFVSHRVTWGDFIPFSKEVAELLFCGEFWNATFKDRVLAAFTQSELRALGMVLMALAYNRWMNQRTTLEETDVALFDRAVSILGDCMIADPYTALRRWRVDSFRGASTADT